MRNWNGSHTDRESLPLRFQTTYEELKLAPVVSPRLPFSPSFQTTYEELKLVKTEYGEITGLRFQTTYEELKLSMNPTTPTI